MIADGRAAIAKFRRIGCPVEVHFRLVIASEQADRGEGTSQEAPDLDPLG